MWLVRIDYLQPSDRGARMKGPLPTRNGTPGPWVGGRRPVGVSKWGLLMDTVPQAYTPRQVPLFMLDLFSGFGGASAAMRARGWHVVTVDNEPRVKPNILADVRSLPLTPCPVDLIWASPPCTYYSRHDQLGIFPGEPEPDHTLYNTARQIIADWQPRFWVIENVRGAVQYWGRPAYRFGPYHLWTNLPFVSQPVWVARRKYNICSGQDPLRSAKRGYLPLPISEVIASAVEAIS